MKEQEYVLRKFVRATSAASALALDSKTDVHEIVLIQDKPVDHAADAVGFKTVAVED